MIRVHFFAGCLAALLCGGGVAFGNGLHQTNSALFDFGYTLRVDLLQLGDQKEERFILDELKREGAWPGPRGDLIDRTMRGSSRAEVYTVSNKPSLQFAVGFSTLFGEWQTTAEAKERARAFSVSVRMPLPKTVVRLVLRSRDAAGHYQERFSTVIDLARTPPHKEHWRRGLRTERLSGTTPPAEALDLAILGDGYEAWQMDKYQKDARRFAEVLLSTEPFSRYRERINVWTVESPSRESGVDEPRKGIYRDTALSMSFNTFDSSRYLMTVDNKAVREVAAHVPYDTLFIISNTGRYGGGGIYNLYASFVADNPYDEYVFVHEFGHSFAGLADEYYTSKVAYSGFYPRGVEPWEPNITAQHVREQVKWRQLIAPETPVPTPEHDRRYRGTVGLFEGAGYSAKGLFRPAVDCKMFDKGAKPFCPVCMDAVARTIERYLGGGRRISPSGEGKASPRSQKTSSTSDTSAPTRSDLPHQ